MPILRSTTTENPTPHHNYTIFPPDQEAYGQSFLFTGAIDGYKCGKACDWHFHDHTEYVFILDGKAWTRIEDVEGDATVGDLLWTPYLAYHQVRAETEMQLYWCVTHQQGQKRWKHLHEEDECDLQRSQPSLAERGIRPIVRCQSIENPPPYLKSSLRPIDMSGIACGALHDYGIDTYIDGAESDLTSTPMDTYIIVLNGTGTARCGDEQEDIKRGDVVLAKSETPVQIKSESGLRILWMLGESLATAV